MYDFHFHAHGMAAMPLGITSIFQAAIRKGGKGKKSVPAKSDPFYQRKEWLSQKSLLPPPKKSLIASYWTELCQLGRRESGKLRLLAEHVFRLLLPK